MVKKISRFLFKSARFVWYRIKAPFWRLIFRLNNERGKMQPYSFLYHGYKVFYLKNDAAAGRIASGMPYEQETVQAAVKYLNNEGVMVDVGANIGLVTLALAAKFPNAFFHCFEPSPIPFRCLRETLVKNSLGRRIFLNNLGLSNRSGTADFFTHGQRDSSGDGLKDTGRAGSASKIKVKITTLDDYVTKIKISRLDLLKIDVEGSELFVLKGATKTLRRLLPAVIFEAWPENLKPFGITFREIFRFWQKSEYRLHTLDGVELSLNDFLKQEGRELNFLALHL